MSKTLIAIGFVGATALNLWLESLQLARPILLLTWVGSYALMVAIIGYRNRTRLVAGWRAFQSVSPADREGLVIRRATYGIGNDADRNVTDTVSRLVKGNCLDLVVDNDVLGGDPFPHTRKTLYVEYSLKANASARERDRLVVPTAEKDDDDVQRAAQLLMQIAARARVVSAQAGNTEDLAVFLKRALDFLSQAFHHRIKADWDAFYDAEHKKLDGHILGGKFDGVRALAQWCDMHAGELTLADIDQRFVMPKAFEQYEHHWDWPPHWQKPTPSIVHTASSPPARGV